MNEPVFRRLRSGRWLVAIALLTTLVGGAAAGFQRACTRPTDVSGNVHIPDWLAKMKEQDAVAYPVHETLGSILATAGCDPTAVGLQWLKAAAHARDPAEVGAAAAGLRQSVVRLGSPAELESALCPFLGHVFASSAQNAALADASLQCADTAPTPDAATGDHHT